MKVIGFTTAGGPEVLGVHELPDPVPGAGEILLRVHAAAVNPTDTIPRSGAREPVGEPPFVVGMDVAGVVEAIGPEADTDLRVGEAAMAIVVPEGSYGGYSELVVVPAESVVRSPAGASPSEAATLPMNGLTARLALDTLDLPAGAVLAVTGAAGALGGYVVQLAKADGLTVVADAKESDRELVAALGADHVLPRGAGYAREVRDVIPAGVDGVVDAALLTEAIVPAAADGAVIVTVRGHVGEYDRGVTFRPIRVHRYARERERLDALRRQVEDGVISLRVAATLPKEEAAEAHRRLEAGGVRGRIVLTF